MVVTTFADATQQSSMSVMDSASRVGLDCIVENSDYTEKLALALESKNYGVKKQVFELLSALCVYSSEGYSRTLEALESFKKHKNERYRFKFIVHELQWGPSVDYQTAIIAFINCLILATSELQERIRIRSEFLGLRLVQILNDLRYKKKECSDLAVQIDVFDEQRESDESQLSPTLLPIDLSSPLEVFDAILRQIADTPQEIPFLAILQHLLRIDSKEAISDLMWDAAERMVHRATLLETREDASRLLNHHQSKLGLSSKGNKGEGRCTCNCHSGRRLSTVNGDALPQVPERGVIAPPAPPPPPPPPPFSAGPPPPPPPPPLFNPSKSAPPPPKPFETSVRLPQQLIPAPKAKMRTVNWNKIPMGEIMNSDKANLWVNFGKNYESSPAASLDWEALEGLFCIPTEKVGGGGSFMGSGVTNLTNLDRPSSKRESSEVLLLDAKRSLNINIFLKQFRSSNKDIVGHIMAANSEEIGSERLRGLLKILPTKDEVEMLRAVPKTDLSRLGSAEKFLLELIGLRAYRLRIEAMLLKEDLEACFHSLDSSISVILQATHEIKNAKHFQDVVFMILVAGNFLNSGGYAGDAVGVKLSSLQKIADIRGNQPGTSLLSFISMQAEAKSPALLSFAKDMVTLEEASKTSIEQIKAELGNLKKKVQLICEQFEKPETPAELAEQLGEGFKEAQLQIEDLEYHLDSVEEARVDLAQFFCEDIASFKLEECFKVLHSFVVRWNQAAGENKRRKQQEEEARQRKRIREEQFQKRLQLGWETPKSVEHFNNNVNKGMTLNPEDEIFIACSPRVVRRRLGSSNTEGTNSGPTTPDQLGLPSPDVTPNGSLRRRRSRVPSDEDDQKSGLMDFLRSSAGGPEGSRERNLKGPEQYGSLDRSWSRKVKRRPNLMDFVNDDRERPVSPAPGLVGSTGEELQDGAPSIVRINEPKPESPAREWRERISAWFVDLENGRSSGDMPQKRPPPRRRLLHLDAVEPGSRGLATLPEGETGTEHETSSPPLVSSYQRVYPDRRPSLRLNTDIVGAMEAIEEVQSPTKERGPTTKRLFERTLSHDSSASGRGRANSRDLRRRSSTALEKVDNIENGQRRSLIESLGAACNDGSKDKLVLYIPEKSLTPSSSSSKKDQDRSLKRSSSVSVNAGRPTSSSGTGKPGTEEGFDRFAAARQSLRYKSNNNTSLSPTSASPLSRSASLYSNVRQRPPKQTEDSTKMSRPSPFTKTEDLMKGPIPIRPVRVMVKASAGEDLKSTRINNGGVINSTNGTTVVQLKSPATTRRNYVTSSNNNSGVHNVEREKDEGFEESHSSLSETNSQIESPYSHATSSGSLKVQQRKPIQRLSGGSFRVSSREIPSHSEMLGLTVPTPIHHNSSGLMNSNNLGKVHNSSKGSLQSSRSSLASQVTVKENNNNGGSQNQTTKVPVSLANTTSSLESRLTHKNLKNHNYNNNSNTPTFMTTQPTTSSTSTEEHKKKSSSGGGGKGLAPRILSFMRPTAASTAKDKAELQSKSKGMGIRRSFR